MTDKYYKMFDILRAPVLTEKSIVYNESSGEVAFYVDVHSDKSSIKYAVEKIFGVKINTIRVLRKPGKVKRFKGKMGVKCARKKVIFSLQEGYSINLGKMEL